jgi:hypothetical protein
MDWSLLFSADLKRSKAFPIGLFHNVLLDNPWCFRPMEREQNVLLDNPWCF